MAYHDRTKPAKETQLATSRIETDLSRISQVSQERDDENWLKHTLSWLAGECEVTLGYRPVHMNTLSNEVQSFPPKARVY